MEVGSVCPSGLRLQGLGASVEKRQAPLSCSALVSLSVLFYIVVMRYLVKARLKPGKEKALLNALQQGTLGQGSIAGDEYEHDMKTARATSDGTVHWVETCFCNTPLEEERPYWEEYFELLKIKDAHNRKNCRHENGTEPWACGDCDCTRRLEERLSESGTSFLALISKAEKQ